MFETAGLVKGRRQLDKKINVRYNIMSVSGFHRVLRKPATFVTGGNLMECKVKNENGTIYIAEDVMLKVVGYAALECYGIVAMSGQKATDGIVEWLGRENLTKGVQIRNVGDMLDVDLYIIVEYGISISEVCKTIVETVRYKLESLTGVKVRKVSISVEGIRV